MSEELEIYVIKRIEWKNHLPRIARDFVPKPSIKEVLYYQGNDVIFGFVGKNDATRFPTPGLAFDILDEVRRAPNIVKDGNHPDFEYKVVRWTVPKSIVYDEDEIVQVMTYVSNPTQMS